VTLRDPAWLINCNLFIFLRHGGTPAKVSITDFVDWQNLVRTNTHRGTGNYLQNQFESVYLLLTIFVLFRKYHYLTDSSFMILLCCLRTRCFWQKMSGLATKCNAQKGFFLNQKLKNISTRNSASLPERNSCRSTYNTVYGCCISTMMQ
jgi:hypothetical protein